MKKRTIIFAAMLAAVSVTSCAEDTAQQENTTNAAVSTVQTETTAAAVIQQIDQSHVERLTKYLDITYTRSINSMTNSLEYGITHALQELGAENTDKLDGEYHHMLPDDLLTKTKRFCPWYDDQTAMTDYAVKIENGKVAAVWTERNVESDLQERLEKLKKTVETGEMADSMDGELWSYLGYTDYDAFIYAIENWKTKTYYGANPRQTVSRYDQMEDSNSGYSDVKPELDKIANS